LKASTCEDLLFISCNIFSAAERLFPSGRLEIRHLKITAVILRSPVVKSSNTCLFVLLPEVALWSSGTIAYVKREKEKTTRIQ